MYTASRIEVSGGVTNIFSIYVKAGVSDWGNIELQYFNPSDTYLGNSYIWFDMANKTIGTNGGAYKGTWSWGTDVNGFHRLINVMNTPSGATECRVNLYCSEGDLDNSFLGDGSNHSYWQQPQVWSGKVAHPPIPTSGSVVETVKDELKFDLNGLDTLFGGVSEQGTVIMKWRAGFDNPGDNTYAGGLSLKSPTNASLFYWKYAAAADFRSYENPNMAVKSKDFSSSDIFNIVVKFGYESGGIIKCRIGIDSGAGVSWSNEKDYDGYEITSDYLDIFLNVYGVNYMGDLWIYNEVKDDDFINSKY